MEKQEGGSCPCTERITVFKHPGKTDWKVSENRYLRQIMTLYDGPSLRSIYSCRFFLSSQHSRTGFFRFILQTLRNILPEISAGRLRISTPGNSALFLSPWRNSSRHRTGISVIAAEDTRSIKINTYPHFSRSLSLTASAVCLISCFSPASAETELIFSAEIPHGLILRKTSRELFRFTAAPKLVKKDLKYTPMETIFLSGFLLKYRPGRFGSQKREIPETDPTASEIAS